MFGDNNKAIKLNTLLLRSINVLCGVTPRTSKLYWNESADTAIQIFFLQITVLQPLYKLHTDINFFYFLLINPVNNTV